MRSRRSRKVVRLFAPCGPQERRRHEVDDYSDARHGLPHDAVSRQEERHLQEPCNDEQGRQTTRPDSSNLSRFSAVFVAAHSSSIAGSAAPRRLQNSDTYTPSPPLTRR